MEHDARGANWTDKLASAIERAADGDVILVDGVHAALLGESAKERMCPEKALIFEARPPFTPSGRSK